MNDLDSNTNYLIIQLILIGVLTSINAFFASAEMALVSVNKTKIKQLSKEGNSSARLLEQLIENPSNFLSTIQIGITLAGFFSSASAATGISEYISNLIKDYNIPYYKELSMICVTLILSYFTLVFGELVPKRIALKKAEKISLFSVKPIYFISKFTNPFIKLLSFSTTLVLKITGNNNEIEEKVSKEEVLTLVSQSQEDGCIADEEKEMIHGIFSFNDKLAREIMTPRNDMFMINLDDNIDDIINYVINSNYTRIPAYRNSIDNIIGILHIKDLLMEAKKIGFENINLEEILHKPYFVLEKQKANNVLKLLKENKSHLALLFDEYGGLSGMVTMEDLIEEIVGDIEDEHDDEDLSIKQIDEQTFYIKGTLSINEFNEIFKTHIEIGDYDTINGYLLTIIGNIPNEGEQFEVEHTKLLISKVDNRRVEKIKLTLSNNQNSLI